MRGAEPSAPVLKLALLVPEPSCTCAETASPASPPLPKLSCWKFHVASVKPML